MLGVAPGGAIVPEGEGLAGIAGTAGTAGVLPGTAGIAGTAGVAGISSAAGETAVKAFVRNASRFSLAFNA